MSAERYSSLPSKEAIQEENILPFLAILNKDTNLLEKLLNNGVSPNAVSIQNGNPLLLAAVIKRDIEAVKLLLQHGANPNSAGLLYGYTPWIFLELKRHLIKPSEDVGDTFSKMRELLLAYNADPAFTCFNGLNAEEIIKGTELFYSGSLIEYYQALDSRNAEMEGLCQGIGVCGAQALLLQQITNKRSLLEFDARFDIIYSTPPSELSSLITQTREKRRQFISEVKKKFHSITNSNCVEFLLNILIENNISTHLRLQIEHVLWGSQQIANKQLNELLIQAEVDRMLTLKERLIIDIPAFFDSVSLAHKNPAIHEGNFHPKQIEGLKSQHLGTLLYFITCEELVRRGGIAILANFSGCYNKDEISLYFSSLKESLINHNITFPFVLKLRGLNHTLSISYDFDSQEWIVINHGQSKRFNDKEITQYILSCEDIFPVFSTQFLAIQENNLALENCIKNWQSNFYMKAMHCLTPEKLLAQDSKGNYWYHLAIAEGNPDLTHQLLESTTSFINRHKQKLSEAAYFSLVDIVIFSCIILACGNLTFTAFLLFTLIMLVTVIIINNIIAIIKAEMHDHLLVEQAQRIEQQNQELDQMLAEKVYDQPLDVEESHVKKSRSKENCCFKFFHSKQRNIESSALIGQPLRVAVS